MNNRTIDSMRPGERGYLNVPRDGNVAQRQRENAAQASPAPGAHAQRPESARAMCYRFGLPESAHVFIQRMLDAENILAATTEMVDDLLKRVAALEKGAKS